MHTLNFRLAIPLLVARKPVCCIYYIELSHIHVARFAINLSRIRIEKRLSDCSDEQAVSVSEITPGASSVDAHIGAQSNLTANGTVFVSGENSESILIFLT